jgi:mRNA interferase RelE/StbE
MKVSVDKSFEKDADKIHDKKLLQKVAECIEQVITCDSIADIQNLKKLQGFKNHYRIRIGDYRAGVIIKNKEIIFERLLHRKDIYKYYP